MNTQIPTMTIDHQETQSHTVEPVSPSPPITRVAAMETSPNPSSPPLSDQVNYKGGPIPDAVRKSYVQQKLPVRKQSLAAFGPNRPSYRQKVPTRRIGSSILHPPPDRLARALTTGMVSSSLAQSPSSSTEYRTPTRSATVASSPPLPSSPSITSSSSIDLNSNLPPALDNSTSEAPTQITANTSLSDLHDSLPSSASSTSLATSTYLTPQQNSPVSTPISKVSIATEEQDANNDDGDEDDDDDDDFNFGDRPPSTINCTRPILSTTSSTNSTVSSLYAIPAAPLKPLNLDTSTKALAHLVLDDKGTTNPLETPTSMNTPLDGPLKDDDDDNSTVFSPSTPAVYYDMNDAVSNWPTPTPSLSETINTEERERNYWRKGSVGDILQTVSSSLPETRRSLLTTYKREEQPQHQYSIGDIDEDDEDILTPTIDVIPDQTKQQLEQQKQIHAYYSPTLSLFPPHATSSALSLQRNASRSSSIFSSPLYPALLSRMAQELYRRLPVRTLVKDDIEYLHAFSGKEAVDCLSQILRTNDRNLGLLVGRALDRQQFFHDVSYEHHLRDSRNKIYQFRQQRQQQQLDLSSDQTSTPLDGASPRTKDGDATTDDMDEKDLPNGVFTLLSNCYSPTCARGQECYSLHCPRKGKPVKRSPSQNSLQEQEEKRSLWIHSVPKSVVEATTKEEMKRQECIYELIYTEADFVKDLQYVHNFWVKPLITQEIIPDERREHFVQEVFWNMADIEKVNHMLSQALTALQKEQHVVHSIGSLLLKHVAHFDPFVAYGAHQIIGKFKFEMEKKRNPAFAQFVQTTERLPESRRLELNGYLTKPTTRLGKYNLLLREILRRTPEDNPDYELLPRVMDLITNYMQQVNTETGKCENIFNLQQLEERLSFKSSAEHVDLALRDPQRQLVIQGRMNRKGNSSSEASDLQVFLFDHYLVFAKIKHFDHLEYYKVYRKPIPLDLLTVTTSSASNFRAKRASTLLAYSRTSVSNASSHSSLPRASTSENLTTSKSTASQSITFYHHGTRNGSPPITLYASTVTSRKTWMEKITQQQTILSEKSAIFTVRHLVERQFLSSNKVHDSIVMNSSDTSKHGGYDDNSTMLVGTDMGVYVRTSHTEEDNWDLQQTMKRVIPLDKISQIELMENSQLLVLADKTLWTFPLEDILDFSEKPLLMKKGRTISTNTAFFHVGECMDKTMVCIAKPNTLATTTIRVLEPVATDENKKTKSGNIISRLVRSGPIGLKPYKDLYLPSGASAISLLKSKMCIFCPREIGVVDMKSFGVQALLDPGDEELSFVFSRQDIRPITIYRVQFSEFLICYNNFAFSVDQRGRWIRSSHIMEWEGEPEAFALSYPYVVAFEPGFIEIRNIITGQVDQRIRGKNIRCTSSREGSIQGSMNDPDNDGYQVIFQLDRIDR